MIDSSFNPTGGEHRVLVVGADQSSSTQLRSLLESGGFRVDAVSQIGDAQKRITALSPAVVLVDLPAAPSADAIAAGDQLIRWAAEAGIAVVVIAAGGDFAPVAELLRRGAADCVTRPASPDELLRRIAIVLLKRDSAGQEDGPLRPERRGRRTKGLATSPQQERRPEETHGLPNDMVVGRSTAIQRLIEQVRMVAPTQTTVLITGETGTGKERVAQAIHVLSLRHKRGMVSVNCGGIPANLLEDEFFGHVKGAFTDAHQARVGRFEQAHRSNIFLDEIGDLPLELQPKLLRVLQEREIHRVGGVETIHIDTRVIAATNADLWSEVVEGRFREDLFYRINVFPIHLPPLRERREDIPLFIEHFLERFCRRDRVAKKQLRPPAEAELMARPWPGNIRELENAVEIAVIRSQDRKMVDIEDFPEPRRPFPSPSRHAAAGAAADFKAIVNQFEHDLIQRVLERTHGNKTQAATMLRLKRTTLVEKLKKLQQLEKQAAPVWPEAEERPVTHEAS